MRRSRPRRNKKILNKNKQRFLIFFILGAVATTAILILHDIYTPRGVKIEKTAPVFKEEILPTPSPSAPAHVKIAIVLDDFGYNYRNVEAIINLKCPVTFSILPNLSYSQSIATRAHLAGYETILHLPLEAYKEEGSLRMEKNTITTSMKDNEVVGILDRALKNTPYIKGLSGHQGSKATESPVLIKTIFVELKNKNLFFLDSLVSRKSVCKNVAQDLGIGFAKRDVFLDNNADFEYIKGQMQRLIRRAKKNGYAVGIGHDRVKTVLALSKLMPEAEKEGIEFVYLSDVIKWPAVLTQIVGERTKRAKP